MKIKDLPADIKARALANQVAQGNKENEKYDFWNLVYHGKFTEARKILQDSMSDLFLRNYDAQLKRGQISDKTDIPDLIKKLREEVDEVEESYIQGSWENPSFDPEEVADVMLVAASMLIKHGYDIPEIIKIKVEYNEKRTD